MDSGALSPQRDKGGTICRSYERKVRTGKGTPLRKAQTGVIFWEP